jgi:iron-regulated transporter 1
MAPFDQQYLLYIMHAFFAFTSRMWDMGIVLLIAHASNNNMAIVAMSGLMSTLSVFLFMGRIGKYLDSTNRLTAAYAALTVKIVTVSTAYFICGILAEESAGLPIVPNLVYLLPFTGALASLSFNTVTQSVEKDWIVVLSDKNSGWLAATNSVMSQIDLACAAFAPAIIGSLFTCYSLSMVAILLFFTNAGSIVGLCFMLRYLYYSYPNLAYRELKQDNKLPNKSSNNSLYESISSTSENNSSRWFRCLGLQEFADCGCAAVMLAYVFLFLTTLNFGSLMTVYLCSAGLQDVYIGN